MSGARFALRPHPRNARNPASALSVDARLEAGALTLRYTLLGDLSAIRFPAVAAPARGHELWQHTCFECFLADEAGRYCEWNFSPALAWAAYAFNGYRSGMHDLEVEQPPALSARGNAIQYALEARLEAPLLRDWLAAGMRRIALSAVIEDRSGQAGYWALRHPAEMPDFHHADGFVLWQD